MIDLYRKLDSGKINEWEMGGDERLGTSAPDNHHVIRITRDDIEKKFFYDRDKTYVCLEITFVTSMILITISCTILYINIKMGIRKFGRCI